MFLTGFLTGFAEQAKDEIVQRNKELRERMDEQFKEHKRKYEAEYALKKEERRVIGERSAVFTDLIKNYPGFENITVGQQLAIIANQKEYEQFQQDMRDLDNVADDKIKAKRIEAIKRGMTGKTNIKYDNIDDAIEAYTQVQDIVRPTAITNKTAFGLKSNIQKDMLDTYKASMPDAFKKVQAKTLKTGGYKGTTATQKLTKADARTTVTTAFQNKIDEYIKDPGGSGPKSTLLLRKQQLGQTFNNTFKEKAKNIEIVSDYQGARLTGLDKLGSGYDGLIAAIKADTALDLIKKTNVDGAISTELASAIENELGMKLFGNQIASGATDIYVTKGNIEDIEKFLEIVDIGPSVGEKTQTIKKKLTGDKDPSDAGTGDFGDTSSADVPKQPDKKEVRALYDRMAAINAQFQAAQGNPRRQKSLKTQYMELLEQLKNDYDMDTAQAQKYLGI